MKREEKEEKKGGGRKIAIWRLREKKVSCLFPVYTEDAEEKEGRTRDSKRGAGSGHRLLLPPFHATAG